MTHLWNYSFISHVVLIFLIPKGYPQSWKFSTKVEELFHFITHACFNTTKYRNGPFHCSQNNVGWFFDFFYKLWVLKILKAKSPSVLGELSIIFEWVKHTIGS
jgi:hypothetical protein